MPGAPAGVTVFTAAARANDLHQAVVWVESLIVRFGNAAAADHAPGAPKHRMNLRWLAPCLALAACAAPVPAPAPVPVGPSEAAPVSALPEQAAPFEPAWRSRLRLGQTPDPTRAAFGWPDRAAAPSGRPGLVSGQR